MRMTKKSRQTSVRCAAVQILQQLDTANGSLTTLLPEAQRRIPDDDRALLSELCFGVARWSVKLSALAALLMEKPLRRKDRDVHWLIQLGLYQLEYMRIAEHAALNTTVAVAVELHKPWARGLVNGVLRQYLRQREQLDDQLDAEARLAFPAWLTQSISADWPEHWQEHLSRSNERPPMVLRVNQRKHSSTAYTEKLHDAGILATPSVVTPSALVLDQPVAVAQLPDFSTGAVSVQDAAAQWAAKLLNPSPGERLLDACAAPGGKTGHLLEYCDETRVTAVHRLERVRENLDRLNMQPRVDVVCADVAQPDAWWDGEFYDAVLLDAPCSGTGVIRRHPDIKLLRRAEDVDELVALQCRMLNALWTVVRPGGRLLYATCSVLKAENQDQISRFLAQHQDASLGSMSPIPQALDTGVGQQLLRGDHDADGFFYALLVRADAQP